MILLRKDLTEEFDPGMEDSRLHGDTLNKDKKEELTKYLDPYLTGLRSFSVKIMLREARSRENFLYDLRCIDGESLQYTRYMTEGQYYG